MRDANESVKILVRRGILTKLHAGIDDGDAEV
jgi:hypothetical protein